MMLWPLNRRFRHCHLFIYCFFIVLLSLIFYSEVTQCNCRLTHKLPSYLASRHYCLFFFGMCVCISLKSGSYVYGYIKSGNKSKLAKI